MQEDLLYDYYEVASSEGEGPDSEFISKLSSFLKEVGFRFVKAELEKQCQEILKPTAKLFGLDASLATRALLSDILEDEESIVGVSDEKGTLFAATTARRVIEPLRKEGGIRRIIRIPRVSLTHIRTQKQEPLTKILKALLKEEKVTMVSEEKSESSINLDRRLANLSSAGKILSQKENQERALALIDKTTWTAISYIHEKEGSVAFPNDVKAVGKKLRMDTNELNSLLKTLSEKKLVNKLLQIVCHRCGAPNLRTDASIDVPALLSKAKCGICSQELKASDVQEVLVLPTDVVKLVEGIWLEEYVKDVVGDRCCKVWQGRFLGNDELDVVGLKLNRVFLFECKTTDVGHTDVYNLVIKARRLGADVSFLVTTKEVVENAKKAIEELSRTEGMAIYWVEGDLESIKKGILGYLDRSISDGLERLFLMAVGIPTYRLRRIREEHPRLTEKKQ